MDILQNKLKELNACEEATLWAQGKTIEEVWDTCPRGDWMLWLFSRTNKEDNRLLTLAKGHCANTVRHLMKDERSINAVDVAIRYGNNQATEEEFNAVAVAAAVAAAAAAYAAAYADAYADAATAAAVVAAAAAAAAAYADAYADAATAAAVAATAAVAAADAAAAAAYAAVAAADARIKNRLETADICRKYLPVPTI